ncbi:hypothetical protein GJQ57_21050 [Ralstonia pickettii]|uniref:Uncharacterized protein n=1 Tax=Ralstonia pickettii TaxID=329 RepID=A0A7X2HR63_RALPI|nr:hypothetical protein [Ralstonia pickettii]MRT01139.1 hypothetical protein [Ralstonia pickettii]
MAGAAQVSVRHVGAAEAIPLLALAERHATTEEKVEALAHAGHCFVMEQEGRTVFAWSVKPQGDELFILAAAGRAGFDLTRAGLAVIEQQAEGFASVAFLTRRPGLMRKAGALGYVPAGRAGNGVIMRKVLQ